jgi:flagellar protein FliS
MTWSKRRAMAAYGEVKVKTGVAFADAARLIEMLFEGCIDSLAMAEGHIARNDIAARTASINKASDILAGLIESLDHERGGEIARNLDEVYRYCLQRLLEANLHNDATRVAEVRGLMASLLEAWRQMPVPGRAAPSAKPLADPLAAAILAS